MMTDMRQWFTIKDACQVLQVSERTLWRRLEQGRYKTKLEDNRRLVRLTEDPEMDTVNSADMRSDIVAGQLQSEVAHLNNTIDRLTAALTEANQQILDTREEYNHRLVDKDAQIESLQTQLTPKDEQISELHQLAALSQTNQAQILKQLEDSKAQRQRRWWQFGVDPRSAARTNSTLVRTRRIHRQC